MHQRRETGKESRGAQQKNTLESNRVQLRTSKAFEIAD
jgi:hypothetical protein